MLKFSEAVWKAGESTHRLWGREDPALSLTRHVASLSLGLLACQLGRMTPAWETTSKCASSACRGAWYITGLQGSGLSELGRARGREGQPASGSGLYTEDDDGGPRGTQETGASGGP